MMRSFLAGLFVTLVTPLFSFAQADFGRELTLTLSPQYPSPGQTTTLSIQTYAVDLDRSVVTWYANDTEIAQGEGLTQASVVVGNLGSETRIVVTAEDEDGTAARAEAVIRPTEIDLLWEADSYVPPFYEGRILPGANSPIRAQALARFASPKGVMVADKDIVYTWYRNDAIVAEGRGKSRVTLQGPALFGSDALRVVAISVDKTLSSEASVRLSSLDPFVFLYENHPLFGVLYHRSIEPGATTLETEQKVTAVPYFASIRSPNDPSLIYEWQVNDMRIASDPKEPQNLIITAEGYQGPVDIQLSLMSETNPFLQALGDWQLIFGSQGSLFSGFNPFGQ